MRLLQLLLIVLFAVMSHIGCFYFYATKCALNLWLQSNIRDIKSIVNVLVVSDIHLLGVRRRTIMERIWNDIQIMLSINAAVDVHRPDLILVLGDQFDEGGPPTRRNQWDEYVSRFFQATSRYHDRKAVYLVGNHDTSFGKNLRTSDIQRFEHAFGFSNEIAHLHGHLFVKINTMALDSDALHTDVHIVTKDFYTNFQRMGRLENTEDTLSNTILLTHLPLYRPNDMNCGSIRTQEGGHITYEEPGFLYTPHHHVLSPELSKDLLEHIQPDIILSGHTHAWCEYKHNSKTTEYTIPTFAWSQRPDPSYAMLQIWTSHSKTFNTVELCQLPNEHFVFALYAFILLSSVCFYLYKKYQIKQYVNEIKIK